jgi:hypothetical protein
MFRIFAFVASVLLCLQFSTSANAVDQNIVLTATVAKFCTIANSATPADDNVTVPVVSGVVTTTPIVRSYAVVCNSAASVALNSINGAMTTSTTSSGGFDTFINYSARASGFASTTAGTTTNSGGPQLLGSANTSGASSATLTVTITPVAGSNPLAGGTYGDTLKVSISPIM